MRVPALSCLDPELRSDEGPNVEEALSFRTEIRWTCAARHSYKRLTIGSHGTKTPPAGAAFGVQLRADGQLQ